MTTSDCKNIQQEFYNYLEDSLSGDEKARVKKHIDSCQTCQLEFNKTKHLIDQLSKLSESKAPEPDPQFWNSFPNQVLSAYKEVTAPTSTKQPGFIEWLRNLVRIHPIMTQGLAYTFLIVLTVTITLYNRHTNSPDMIYHLAQLENPKKVEEYLEQHNRLNRDSSFFAFSDQATTNYFRLGTVYSYISLYLSTGNTDKSSRYLYQIEKMFIDSPEIKKEYNTIASKLKQTDLDTQQRQELTSKLFRLFQKIINDKKHSLDGTMFELGIWTNNMMVSAATNNISSLSGSDNNIYFNLTENTTLPPGTVDRIKKINKLLENNSESKNRQTKIEKLCREIQTVLL